MNINFLEVLTPPPAIYHFQNILIQIFHFCSDSPLKVEMFWKISSGYIPRLDIPEFIKVMYISYQLLSEHIKKPLQHLPVILN